MMRDEVLAVIKQAEDEGWEELDLSGQGLEELPEEIGRLRYARGIALGRGRRVKGVRPAGVKVIDQASVSPVGPTRTD